MRFFFKVEFASGKVSQTRSIDSNRCVLVLDVLERILDEKLQLHPRDSLMWEALNSTDRSELQTSCSLEDLDKENGPGSINNPFLLVSPEADIKKAKQVLFYQGIAPQVLSELSDKFLRVPADLAELIFAGESTPHHSHQAGEPAPSRKADFILYKRNSFRKQIEFLEEQVIKGMKRGWILGPPGTGKSVSAFVFARNIASSGWISSWIKCIAGVPLYCIRFSGNTWCSSKITDNLTAIDLLESADESNHMVIIDGYRNGKMDLEKLLKGTKEWWRDKISERRIVVVASVAAREGNDTDEQMHEEEFFEDSWVQEEFVAACEHPDLLAFAKINLDAPLRSDALNPPTTKDLIEAKMYYAGGSARYMFQFKTEKVIHEIRRAVGQVDNVPSYISQCIADTNKSIVNRLANSYHTPSGIRRGSILSDFVALELATKGGPLAIRSIRDALRAQDNKAIDGWIFELLFFANLTCVGLKLKRKSGPIQEFMKAYWPLESEVPANKELFYGQKDAWIKPAKWNQAGFDAVLISPTTKTIHFFQVTRSLKHDLALRHFADCLKGLDTQLNFEIVINVVVPISNLKKFTPNVTDISAIKKISNSWSSDSNVIILGMEDI